MPTYVYHCGACDTTFEASQRMSDPPLTECECGEKGQVKRQLSAGAGIIFKGSGFYQTDYKGGGGSDKSESTSDSKSDAKGDSKTESKTEKKAESKPAESAASSSGGSCGSGCGCHS